MSAAKAPWDGVERRKADAPLGLTALHIATRVADDGGTAFDNAHARPGDLDNEVLKARVGTILAVALGEPEAAPYDPEKVLTPDQKATLFSTLQSRVEGDVWPSIQRVLDAMYERFLYGLFQMEEHGHKIGITSEERGGEKGFRFDSCSAESPSGIRNVNYFQAEDIAEKGWGIPLMPREVFNELRRAGVITNLNTWDHLKTENPGTREKPGLSWLGDSAGTYKLGADLHDHDTGFRCSLWFPEV